MAQNRIMGRRRQENTVTKRTNKSIEDTVENEGDEYMVANPGE
jgi:hypothetical protein